MPTLDEKFVSLLAYTAYSVEHDERLSEPFRLRTLGPENCFIGGSLDDVLDQALLFLSACRSRSEKDQADPGSEIPAGMCG